MVTRDVAKGLGIFTERYLNEPTANGVWISGFFGSGSRTCSKCCRSSSMAAPSQRCPSRRHPPSEDRGRNRAWDLRKAAAIPSRSILFNIDQKFDGIGGDHSAPILEVFVKVLNELQGYYGKQGYIAQFEHDLDSAAIRPFKETYLESTAALGTGP